MNIPCAMIRDLLPLYAEKMVESETETLIKDHLKTCPDCRQRLNGIEQKGSIPLKGSHDTPAVTAKPLKALKKEIAKRRWCAAAMAALLVFAVLYPWAVRQNEMKQVAWEDGLIEVKGTEIRPYEEMYGVSAESAQAEPVEALVINVSGRINGTRETMVTDEDGKSTLLLQGWTSQRGGSLSGNYNEMVFCPVPDRLIYEDGVQNVLLWGEPMNGGVVTLPRLALSFYLLLAAGLAAVSGIAWFLLRCRDKSWIVRQVFFSPAAYLIAHFLVKGTRTATFFLERDLAAILLTALALYILITLAWQMVLMRKREKTDNTVEIK